VVLKSVVDDVLKGNNGPLGDSHGTIRDFQIALERQLHLTVKELACYTEVTIPLSKRSVKWLASYAYETTDLDQELRRFEEYLNSRQFAQELILKVPVVADERQGEVDGLIWDEGACDRRSQWFGNPEAKEGSLCSIKSRPLYKILSYKNEKDDHTYQDDQAKDLFGRLLSRVKDVRADKARIVRFFVLGYEIPWDEDGTLIRYGIRFYFIDTLTLGRALQIRVRQKSNTLVMSWTMPTKPRLSPFSRIIRKAVCPAKTRGRPHVDQHACPSKKEKSPNVVGGNQLRLVSRWSIRFFRAEMSVSRA